MLNKGESKILEVTEKARHRVVAGMSWDPVEPTGTEATSQFFSSVREALNGDFVRFRANWGRLFRKFDDTDREVKDPNYDIDLYCYAYGEDGEFIALVDPTAWNAIDEEGAFYHSGDSGTGYSKHDDEQIHLELKTSKGHYHHFIFVAESDELHKFGKVAQARFRVTDCMSGSEFLNINLSGKEAQGHYAYVFCHIYLNGEKWHIRYLGDFCDKPEDWSEYLTKKYL